MTSKQDIGMVDHAQASGSVVDTNGETEADINSRINKARVVKNLKTPVHSGASSRCLLVLEKPHSANYQMGFPWTKIQKYQHRKDSFYLRFSEFSGIVNKNGVF